MKIQTRENEIIGIALLSFLFGWYCATTPQFIWGDWWLLGMSLSLWMFIASTTMRPISTFRIWYSIGLIVFYFLLWYSHVGLRI